MSNQEREMSRRNFLEISGKTVMIGGMLIAAGGGGLLIEELDETNREVQKTHRPIPIEEVNAAEKVIVKFQIDALLTAKGSINDRQDVVEVPLRDPRGLANAFAVSDNVAAYQQEMQRVQNERGQVKKSGGVFAAIIGIFLTLIGLNKWIRSEEFKKAHSPTNNPS